MTRGNVRFVGGGWGVPVASDRTGQRWYGTKEPERRGGGVHPQRDDQRWEAISQHKRRGKQGWW